MEKHRRLPMINLSDEVVEDSFYALPRVATACIFTPIYIVPGIYAKYYGLSLTTIAGVILFARLFDAITDPIIGYLSDKFRLKRGTRKPAMILGAIVLIGSGYFLYSPPDDVSAAYLAFWFIVFYLGYTLFEIPHLAWGGEISQGTHAKTQTYTLRALAAYCGLVLFYSIPLLPIWETTDITPKTLEFAAIFSGLLMLPLLYLCMKRVPDGSCYSEEPSTVDKRGQLAKASFPQFTKTVKSVIHNKPLLLFFGAFLFAGIGMGSWYGLLFNYVDAYLGMGVLFAKITAVAWAASIPCALIWFRIAKYLGKKNAWLLVMLLAIAAIVYSGFLDPGNAGYWSLLILSITFNLCLICMEFLPQSLLSDIVDYSSWKFRTYRGSTYFALYMFTYKGATAVGSALGFAIAGWYGFDPSSTSQTESGIIGLKLAMICAPPVLVVISIIFIAFSPITTRRHGIIRRRLDALETRSKKENGKSLTFDKGATENILMTH